MGFGSRTRVKGKRGREREELKKGREKNKKETKRTAVLPPAWIQLKSCPACTMVFGSRKCCLTSVWPLLLHPVLSHSLLLPSVFGCYCQQSSDGSTAIWLWVFETHTSAPYLLGFYTTLMSDLLLVPGQSVSRCQFAVSYDDL